MIIDTHAHLGFDFVFDEDFTEAELVEGQQANAIDVTIVQPGTAHDLGNVQTYHDQIADLCKRYPGRFYGMANPNPHLPGDQYPRELRRCVEELGFIAVKVNPRAHAVNPTGIHGRMVFELAAEFDIPVMVHTGSGIPWSAPSLLGPMAAEHPQVKIILAHAGGVLAGEAAELMGRHDNVFMECSWTAGFNIGHWVKQFGAERIMFGSDHADNAAVELVKFRGLSLSDDELNMVLGQTAAEVFKIEVV